MANVMFKKGLVASLPNTYSEGTFYVTTDERAIYLDVSDSARIRLGDFQEFATLDALKANTNPSTSALYYVADINCLAKFNGTDYVQINRDTGMTSVEVVGEGNAVTAAVYSADGRKLTLTKGATYMTSSDVDGKISAAVGDIEGTVKAYVDKKTEGIATNAALSELQGKVEQAEKDIDALEKDTHTHGNKDLLDTYTQTEANLADAVAKKHEHANAEELAKIASGDKAKWDAEIGSAAAIAAMKDGESIDSFKDVETALAGKQAAGDYATKTEAQGYANAKDEAIAAAQKAGDDAMAEAQKKVASVAAGDASVTVGGTATAPTVAAKLSADADNALKLAADGLKVVIPAAAEYTIEKAADSGDYAAVYALKKDGVQVGASINIPKDMVVKSGSVVDGDIVLVLNDEANTEIVIPADSLIEYVTSGSATGDMVVVSVSDDHKVTATITDGTITLAKLASDVQTAIGKAHSHENADVLAGIDADKVAAWDAAEKNAKDYADGLNGAMDTRVKAVEAKAHEHANKDELDLIAAGDKAKWDAAAGKAHEHANKAELDKIADGDVAKWNGAQAAAEATAAAALSGAKTELEGKISAAQTAAEKVANDNNAAMDTRVKALEAIDHDAYKGYADQAEADAVATAKAYTDTALTWGSF